MANETWTTNSDDGIQLQIKRQYVDTIAAELDIEIPEDYIMAIVGVYVGIVNQDLDKLMKRAIIQVLTASDKISMDDKVKLLCKKINLGG